MAIKRAKRKSNFTMISNVGLKDEKLSFKAKGLLAYMLSLPDDWVFYETELVNHSTDGLASVKSGLKELQERGYLDRNRERNAKGQLKETNWTIHDEPTCDFPTLEKPTLEKPTLENHTLLNTNPTKDLSKLNTNNTNTHSDKPNENDLQQRFDELWKQYPNKKAKPKAFTAYKRAIKEGATDEEIAKGIENYNKEIEIKRTDKQYIAHASTWFNQKRWNDEYEAAVAGGVDSDWDFFS